MKALVTGGGGFLGGAIVRKLLASGTHVVSFTRSVNPWLSELGVDQVQGDLAELESLNQAMHGCDVVFHTAAKAGVWGRYEDFHSANVVGTENVIAACLSQGVSRLVHTSTPSVVHAGSSIEGGNESLPYPTKFSAYYPESKAIAEMAVLSSNGPKLATVALRPHLIWGPGDPHLIPRVLARARQGKLRRVGSKPVMVDLTYIENAADAHLQAAEKLTPKSPAAGKAYFITDGEPVDLWSFLNRVLALANVPPITKSVSAWKARLAGRLFELTYRLFRLSGEPPMTRFTASQLSTSHWFDISAARRDLGYEPRVSVEEGLKRLARSFEPDTVGEVKGSSVVLTRRR